MSQNADILRHLKTEGSITPLQALHNYGCMRLAARVNDLRDKGHSIDAVIVEVSKGKRVARYSIKGRK